MLTVFTSCCYKKSGLTSFGVRLEVFLGGVSATLPLACAYLAMSLQVWPNVAPGARKGMIMH